jgi:MFS family permease
MARRTSLGPSYRRLLAASAASNLADGVFQIALPLLAVSITRSPGLVAGVAVAQRLPWLVMALPAGALADRLDRRRTMVNVNVVRVAVMAAVAVAAGTDTASVPVLYAAALVLGVGETLFDTAAQSILPSLVDRGRLSEANGRLYAVELILNQFAGPPLGGLLAALGLWVAFGTSAVAYAAAAAGLAVISGTFRTDRGGTAPSSIRSDIAEGLRFVWRHSVLRTLGLMLGAANLASAAHFAVFVLFAVDPGPMGLSEAGFGILFATSALGGVIGSQIAPWAERVLGRWGSLVLSTVAFGVGLAVPAVTPNVVANAAAFVGVGTAMVVWNVITVSLRQRITPDRLLGRMNAAYRLLGWGTIPIGAALGGLVAERFGLRTTFAVAALLHLPILVGFAWLRSEALVAADAEPEAQPAPPP